MGCIFSKKDSGRKNPRVFKVKNVDDQGVELSSGKIEITDVNLQLYQKGKEPIRWPLRSLRRYGFDAELFSFESGRRCPTGPGIYAFKCRRAEALFNLLQECIQKAGQEEAPHDEIDNSRNGSLVDGSFPLPVAGYDFPHAGRMRHPYMNGVPGSDHSSTVVENTRISDYINTVSVSSPSHRLSIERNIIDPNNPNNNGIAGVHYATLDLQSLGQEDPTEHYKVPSNNCCLTSDCQSCHQKLLGPDGDPSSSQVTYINVRTPLDQPGNSKSQNDTKETLQDVAMVANKGSGEETGRVYANIDYQQCANGNSQRHLHESRGCKVNYIQLDLKNSNDNISIAPANPSPSSPISLNSFVPESPSRKGGTDSYATIDFNKTAALYNSVIKSNQDEEDGARKTRHNSNIDELN